MFLQLCFIKSKSNSKKFWSEDNSSDNAEEIDSKEDLKETGDIPTKSKDKVDSKVKTTTKKKKTIIPSDRTKKKKKKVTTHLAMCKKR